MTAASDPRSGWGMPPTELLRVRVMDWIYDRQMQDPARGAQDINDFDPEALDRSPIGQVLNALEATNLVRLERCLGGVGGAMLKPDGINEVEQRRQRRSDPARRRRACRDAFLYWLSLQDSEMVVVERFFSSDLSFYEGERLRKEDVGSATEYLKERGLIDGIGVAEESGVIRARLLADGSDCLELFDGSVSRYVNRHQQSPGTTYHTHFHEVIHGQVGIGENVTQTQHQGIDGDTLQRLLDDVRTAAEQIDPSEAAYLLTYVDTLRAEVVADQPNTAMIQGSGDRLKQIAMKSSNAALMTAVTTLVVAVFRAFGVG
jgi:hypothetical protein